MAEQQEKKKGFFSRLVSGLSKTRDNIVAGFDNIFTGYASIDDDFYDEIEETLIMGDIGITATESIMQDLKQKVRDQRIRDPQKCKQLLIDSIRDEMKVCDTDYEFERRKSVVLVVGVNGVGKTTTIGKLANNLRKDGNKVLLSAADTFRAAAIDQLEIWAQRSKCDIVKQNEGSDPAAVVFDSIRAAKARGTDIIICDTAGRLHNKKHLMDELNKISRIIDRELPDADKEVLLVLDATTGQNAVNQAREFKNAAGITGIVLTKLDGTAKGGVVLSIKEELDVPVKYIGVGEQIDDLQPFDPQDFAKALFDVEKEE